MINIQLVRINVTTNFAPISLIALRSLEECSLIQRLIIAIFSQRKRFDRNRNDQTENRNRPIAYGLAQRRKSHDNDTIAIVRRTGIGPLVRPRGRSQRRNAQHQPAFRTAGRWNLFLPCAPTLSDAVVSVQFAEMFLFSSLRYLNSRNQTTRSSKFREIS